MKPVLSVPGCWFLRLFFRERAQLVSGFLRRTAMLSGAFQVDVSEAVPKAVE